MFSIQFSRSIRKLPARCFSSSGSKMLDLVIDNEGIAVMSWQRRPVNSLSLEFIQEIKESLNCLEKNENYKGLIIASAIPKIFSAGIDLAELNNPDPARLSEFSTTLEDLFLKLYTSVATTTVAINGFTAAGGCVLSLMCDYRVMVGSSSIGMNDTAVGIVPARWLQEVMIRTMGYRQAEIAIIASKMYTTEEALKVQMIDEIATDPEDAIEKCKTFIRLYDHVPRKTYITTKRQLRERVTNDIEDNRGMGKEMLERIMNPYTQEQIGKYVEQLKQRKLNKNK